jgi:phage-related protein
MMSELDKFIASQAKLNTLSKQQGQSINILNLKYKVLNKTLGPFYKLYVDVKNAADTTKDVFEALTEQTEEMGEVTEKALTPFQVFLKTFKQINTMMFFVLGAFTLIGAAIFLLTQQFGGGEAAASTFGMVIDAGKAILDAFMGVVSAIGEALGAIDFEATTGIFIIILETIFGVLGNILTLYFTLLAAILNGIAEIVTRMNEEGMLQRIVDAFGVFFGLIGMSLGIIKDAFDDVGLNMGSLISGINMAVSGFVDFLFNSGIMEFAVKVIEYVAIIWGVIAVLFASVVSIFIRVWGTIGPPLVRFVAAWFNFLEPIIRIVTGIIGMILDAVMGLIGFLMPYLDDAMDGIMFLLQPILDAIETILDGASEAMSIGGDIIGGAADFFGFNDGGIASGPKSGYPVTLHGTEAIVPLPDGRTIPVSIKGDIGGRGSQTNNININVTGGGDSREIARAVSNEVSKVLRNRSRGGNYTRGVI